MNREDCRADVICALEDFADAQDFSVAACRKFREKTLRSIKVSYAHLGPAVIDEEVRRAWPTVLSIPLAW